MQLRDQKPNIFYPGHWGLFGGAIEENEDPTVALKRELRKNDASIFRSVPISRTSLLITDRTAPCSVVFMK